MDKDHLAAPCGERVAGFTPGPWEVVRWHEDGDERSAWRILGTTPTGLEGCYSVAEVIDGNGLPQNAANARLIAAAPALFAALQRLLPAYREAVRLYDPNHDDAFTVAAHNALAAASPPLPHQGAEVTTGPILPDLPDAAFRLKWRDGAYYVTKPNIDDTDVFTPAQVNAIRQSAVNAALEWAAQQAANAKAGGESHDYIAGALGMSGLIATAIRAAIKESEHG